jgi:hypothetical protein
MDPNAAAQAAQAAPEEEDKFMYAPGQRGKIMDYTTSEGMKAHNAATAALSTMYDLTSDKLLTFIRQLKARSKGQGGFEEILEVDVDPIENPMTKLTYLLDSFGQLSYEQCKAHTDTYYKSKSRAAQDSHNLFTCIENSLTEEAKEKLLTKEPKYLIKGRYVGVLYLHVIIEAATIDTRYTIHELHNKLHKMTDLVESKKSNVEDINQAVEMIELGLTSRGATTDDIGLTTQLLRMYAKIEDPEFQSFIKTIKSDIETDKQVYNSEQIKKMALNKYKCLKESEEWQAHPGVDKDQKIIALEAQILAMATTTQGDNPRQQKKRGRRPKDPWMLIPPKSSELKEKIVNNVRYLWCDIHQWCKHNNDMCNEQKKSNKKVKWATNEQQSPTLQMQSTMQALMMEDSD